MGTFHTSDHSGMFSFLGGVSVLVLIAVGASLVLENHALGPKNKITSFERETALMEGRAKIRKVRAELSELEVQRILQQKNVDSLVSIPRLNKALSERIRLQGLLEEEGQGLRAEIEGIQDSWLSYRHRRRKLVRREMTGKYIGDFVLKSGRSYRNVVIKSIDQAGISIRYSGGSTRVLARDLADEVLLDLDLSLDEAEAVIKQERAEEEIRRKRIRKTIVALEKAESYAENPKLDKEPASKRLLEAKFKVEDLARRMYSAQSEASRARSNHVFNPNRSMTQGLESWKARAKRMERAAIKYREQIDRAVRKVKKLAPNYQGPALD